MKLRSTIVVEVEWADVERDLRDMQVSEEEIPQAKAEFLGGTERFSEALTEVLTDADPTIRVVSCESQVCIPHG